MMKRPDKLERLAPASLPKLENLARDKHSSLLRTFVNYWRKCFTTLAQGYQTVFFVTDTVWYNIVAAR